MSANKLLLCTDMDRTIIPNGTQSEHRLARKRFAEFCNHTEITLAYITGRYLQMVLDAIRIYRLPIPDYIVSDVGTKIYHMKSGRWTEIKSWTDEIAKDWNGYSQRDLKKLFADITVLKLQENSKQSQHKLSYYAPVKTDTHTLLAQMKQKLEDNAINASLVWSIDEPKGIGLLDVLPKNATKLHAIEFLRQQLGFSIEETVFAGDSGNDLPVIASGIPSTLVANAADSVRREAIKLAQNHKQSSTLYLANGANSDMNGNYSAGVLEGVWHFAPLLRPNLETIGFHYE